MNRSTHSAPFYRHRTFGYKPVVDITREGLSEIEAANKLGISKMLSGSFVAVGGTLRIGAARRESDPVGKPAGIARRA